MADFELNLKKLASRYPLLRDPSLWPNLLPERDVDRFAVLLAREAPEVCEDDAPEPSWFVLLLSKVRWASAASAIPPAFLPTDWAGRHLVLYLVASIYVFGIAGLLTYLRAGMAAIAAAALGLLALVDAVAWIRIYPVVGEFAFPAQLAAIDVTAYFVIVLAAHFLVKSARRTPYAPPARPVYLFFTGYCYGACFYWYLLSGPLAGDPLVTAIRNEWQLDAIAVACGFPQIDGLIFMSWLVWALYGISGTVSLILLARRDSLRVTVRWLLIPCSLYGAMGPWISDSWQWFRYLFLVLPAAAFTDWIVSWWRDRR